MVHFVAFPIEIIQLITWYLPISGAMSLYLTGNLVLRRKILGMYSLAVCWRSSKLCDWDACKSYLNRFSHLNELYLCTEWNAQISKRRLNLEIFPTNLTSLHLKYRGCFELLQLNRIGFPIGHHLPHLTMLFLQQRKGDYLPDFKVLDLAHLPPRLLHLHLHRSVKADYQFFAQDLESLPADLQTFDVNLKPLDGLSGVASTKPISFGHPDKPSSLTFICAVPLPDGFIDVSNVASGLQKLRVVKGVGATYQGEEISKLSSSTLSQAFPQLNSLVVPNQKFEWSIFEDLPPSLTRFIGDFSANVHMLSVTKMCARLNFVYRNSISSNDRPGAPMLLREFLFPSGIFRSSLGDLMHEFPALLDISMKDDSPDGRDIPRTLRYFKTRCINSDQIPHLPKTLTFLTTMSMVGAIVTASPKMRESSFPPLTSLHINFQILGSTEVKLLPSTLQNLTTPLSMSALEELAKLANVDHRFPHLVYLRLISPKNDPTNKTIKLGIDTLPSTITELHLKGKCLFEKSARLGPLSEHRSLLRLFSDEPLPAKTLFLQLPPQLLECHMVLAAPFNIQDPEIVRSLQNWPSNLRSLHLGMSPGRDLVRPIGGLAPKNYCTHLAGAASSIFGSMMWLPWDLWSPTLRYHLTEAWMLQQLPPTLTDLNLPLDGPHIPTRSWKDVFNFCLSDFPQRLALTRFPLLAVGSQFKPSSGSPIESYAARKVELLPPNLSQFSSGDDELKTKFEAQKIPPNLPIPDEIPTGFNVPRNHQTANAPLPSRDLSPFFTYHLMNLLTWIAGVISVRHLNHEDHPIIFMMQFCNIVGSALLLIILFFKIRNSSNPKFFANFSWGMIRDYFFTTLFIITFFGAKNDFTWKSYLYVSSAVSMEFSFHKLMSTVLV